jgi:hypothetical protein
MNRAGLSASRSRAAFTVLELAIAAGIMGVLGYSLSLAVKMSRDSQQTVSRVARESRSTRESIAQLIQDVRESTNGRITVTVLADNNHEVTLQQPIDVAGAMVWGVFDRTLGPTDAEWSRQDWFVRYTVRSVVGPTGAQMRQLVRRILDDGFVVQREEVLVEDLRSGNDVPPGFQMVQAGDVWEITLTTEGESANSSGKLSEFHVRPRN